MGSFNFVIKLLTFISLAFLAIAMAFMDASHFFKAQWRLDTIAMLVQQGEGKPRDTGEYLLASNHVYLRGMLTVEKPPRLPKNMHNQDTSDCLAVSAKTETGRSRGLTRTRWTTLQNVTELGDNWRIGNWNVYPANFSKMPLVMDARQRVADLDTDDGDKIRWCGTGERCREKFSCYVQQPVSMIGHLRYNEQGEIYAWPAWMLTGVYETPQEFEAAFRIEQSKPFVDWRARLWLGLLLFANTLIYYFTFRGTGLNPFTRKNGWLKLELALAGVLTPALQYLAFRFVTMPLIGYGFVLLSGGLLLFFIMMCLMLVVKNIKPTHKSTVGKGTAY